MRTECSSPVVVINSFRLGKSATGDVAGENVSTTSTGNDIKFAPGAASSLLQLEVRQIKVLSGVLDVISFLYAAQKAMAGNRLAAGVLTMAP